jgi:NAD(P)-dependent dehydrogenase (short-subunit alcohol dehydrogenase family)
MKTPLIKNMAAVVTGAGSGIGQALALQLARKGLSPGVGGRQP